MEFRKSKIKEFYKQVKKGEVSAKQVREIYRTSKFGQCNLSATLFGLGYSNANSKKRAHERIYHLSKYDCYKEQDKFLKSFVMCIKGNQVIEHKVGKCPHYTL